MDNEYINENYMEILENYISGDKETMKELLVLAIKKLIERNKNLEETLKFLKERM